LMAVRDIVDLRHKVWHEDSQASILAVKADTLEVILRNFVRDLYITWGLLRAWLLRLLKTHTNGS
jgi:hypothetical protein